MRLQILFSIIVSLIGSVSAQAALIALAEQLPTCSSACFTAEIPNSDCATNLTSACLCTNVALNAAVSACATETCTVYELLRTKNISSESCGVPSRYSGRRFIILGIGGVVVAVLAFLLRLGASLPSTGRQLSWDDATMALVVVLAIPPAVFAPILVKNGLGRDMWTLEAHQITNVLHFYFFGEIFYILALGLSKISILCFYLRVFPAKDFRRQIYIVMGACGAYTIAFFFATTLQCIPVSYAWNQWDGLHDGRCNNIHLQGWVAAAINIALDAVVMVLPLRHLARLNMTLKKKLMVMSMFSVGIIVILISSLRLYSLVHFANSTNITWDYVEAGYWSLLEIDVSIVCGCMPAHRMLIAKAWPRIRSTFHSTNKDSTNSTGFSASSNQKSVPSDKTINISIKPRLGDESDFVPLVDLYTRSTHEPTRSVLGSSHPLNDRLVRTTPGNMSQPDNASTDSHDRETPEDWPMRQSAMGKEHV